MTRGHARKPRDISRPGPSKKPDGGSGSRGGDNGGASKVIHGIEGKDM